MSYVLISTQIRLEQGPTLCGDEYSDPAVMKHLDAHLEMDSSRTYQVYKSQHAPRTVLNRLAELGYRVVGTAGAGQTCIWTLYKETDSK